MDVLIKLDKRLYNYAKHHTLTSAEIDEICDVITTGIQLPKGHGRLVDIDKVRTELDWLEKVTNEGSIVEQAAHRKLIQCINVVNAAPTIIEADKAGEGEE